MACSKIEIMKKGLLIIYSGPSGVGKSTILSKVLKEKDLNLAFSVSMTTRKPRDGEKDGKDYFFVEKEEFEKAIENDEFLEYASYVDNYYGTPKAYVDSKRSKGKNVILEIDVQGGLQVIEKCPDAISLFIEPPSIEILKNRLIGRGTDEISVIEKRLKQVKREIKTAKSYKYHIVNDDLDKAVNEVIEIIKKEMN